MNRSTAALVTITRVLSERPHLLDRDDELWGAYTQCVAALAAQVDTHAKRGDPSGAPSPMGSAVGEADAPTLSRPSSPPTKRG
jgi:hypothetical protein